MSNSKRLKDMLIAALNSNTETVDDIIYISHPLELLDEIGTLEEIQCFYLNSCWASNNDWYDRISECVHKQDMPFVALTSQFLYYANEHYNEVESYRRDD